MAIDNVYDAIDKQNPEEGDGVVSSISRAFDGAKALGIPIPEPITAFFNVLDSMSREAKEQRGIAFIQQLVEDMQKVQNDVAKMRTSIDEIQSAMRLSIQYDVNEFNDAKRTRYISAITVSISSQTKIQDLSTFVQDIEQLGERDIIGLKILNRVMNRESDWKDAPSPAIFNPSRLHPNTFIHRAAEFSAAMTEALTGKSASSLGQAYSREDGLQICYRLQGFGLAQVIEVSQREVPISDYCARPTSRGLMLLKLIGESVPNWSRYFSPDGAL
jgi:hypothetical protein